MKVRIFSSRLPLAVMALLIAGLCLPVLAQDSGGPPDGDPPHGNGPPDGAGPPPGRGKPPEGRGPGAGSGPPPGRGPRLGSPRDRDSQRPGGIPMFCTPGGNTGGPAGQAGLSSIAMLDFDQEDGDASGKLVYRWIAPMFDFVFNARGLEPEERTYTLVAYPDEICLGTANSTADGTFHLQNALDIGTDLPAEGNEDEEQALATIALIENDSDDVTDDNCAVGELVLQGVEGMFYVRHVDEADGDEDEDEEGNGEG